jgi:hypothetical protein
VARHENETELGVRGRQTLEDIEGVRLFRLLRAAGEEHDMLVVEACQLSQRDCF